MTGEEAIYWIENLSGSWDGQYREARDMAIAALREQEERKHCKWCEDMDTVYDIVCYLPHDNGSATDIPLRVCPVCGRRLEEV